MSKIITTVSEYNLEIHKRVLGVHTDKDGNEFVYQPERSKREDCENGFHFKHSHMENLSDEWKCEKCSAIIRRCGALNSVET